MRIATTYDEGNIFQHFGHTAQFKIYDIADGTIEAATVIHTDGNGHSMLSELLKSENVDTLICGGIGEGAKNMLAAAGIKLFGGVSGSADEAVTALLQGNLQYDPDVECSHHEEHGQGECHGAHGCGEHNH